MTKGVLDVTSVNDVQEILEKMTDNKTAQLWLKNDIVKMKLARSYDECYEDADGEYISLHDHIEYYIDHAKELNMHVE